MVDLPRAAPRLVSSLESSDGYAFGPVLLGALLGAGLGVILAMLMENGLHFAAQGLNLSLPFGAWCAGALAGAVLGGLLSALIGGDETEPTRFDPLRRTPTR
jgi:hypothetical protein